jgi:hypothetical protein
MENRQIRGGMTGRTDFHKGSTREDSRIREFPQKIVEHFCHDPIAPQRRNRRLAMEGARRAADENGLNSKRFLIPGRPEQARPAYPYPGRVLQPSR